VGSLLVLKKGTGIDRASLSRLASAYPASTACCVINKIVGNEKKEFGGKEENPILLSIVVE
jgi:hypothetical protein